LNKSGRLTMTFDLENYFITMQRVMQRTVLLSKFSLGTHCHDLGHDSQMTSCLK